MENESDTSEEHPIEGDDVDETMASSFLVVDEETSEELSKLLDMFFEAPPPPIKVRFIDDPYSALVVFQSSSSYVTINGNDESCGSSFSDYESSVMASVDRGGLPGARGFFSGEWGGNGDVEDDDGDDCVERLLNDCDGDDEGRVWLPVKEH